MREARANTSVMVHVTILLHASCAPLPCLLSRVHAHAHKHKYMCGHVHTCTRTCTYKAHANTHTIDQTIEQVHKMVVFQ